MPVWNGPDGSPPVRGSRHCTKHRRKRSWRCSRPISQPRRRRPFAASNERSQNSFDLDRSVALFVGEELAGGLLYSWNDGLPAIDALAVGPSFRNTSAVVLLLTAATRNGLDGGATRFRFSCGEDNRDTIKLARRCGAKAIRVEAEYRLVSRRLD